MFVYKQSQLETAVAGEEYTDAAKLKVAIAAVSSSDTVGKVMALLEVGRFLMFRSCVFLGR